MQQRERLLMYGLIAIVVVWWGSSIAHRIVVAPITDRKAQISDLTASNSGLDLKALQVDVSERKLAGWKAQSLPANPVEAQRLYLQWLTDVALEAGFVEPVLTPQSLSNQQNIYTAVPVKIQAETTLRRLSDFLFRFYQADLLHSISLLTIASEEHVGNPPLSVTIVATGLSLKNGPARTTLFPEGGEKRINPRMKDKQFDDYREFIANSPFAKKTELVAADVKLEPIGDKTVIRGEPLSVAVKTKGVDASQARLRFRLDGEVPAGMSIDRRTGQFDWVPAEGQPTGKFPVTIAVYQAGFEQPLASETINVTFREKNIAPDVEAVAEQSLYLGQTLKLAIKGSDKDKDELKYTMENPPQGATVDEKSGELTWKPPETLEPKEYEVAVLVTDNGLPPMNATAKFKVKVSDDAAKYTFLVGSVTRDGTPEAHLYDQSANKQTVLKVGGAFESADVKGTIVSIERDHVIVRSADRNWRLDLGSNLRSLKEMPAAESAEAPKEPS